MQTIAADYASLTGGNSFTLSIIPVAGFILDNTCDSAVQSDVNKNSDLKLYSNFTKWTL